MIPPHGTHGYISCNVVLCSKFQGPTGYMYTHKDKERRETARCQQTYTWQSSTPIRTILAETPQQVCTDELQCCQPHLIVWVLTTVLHGPHHQVVHLLLTAQGHREGGRFFFSLLYTFFLSLQIAQVRNSFNCSLVNVIYFTIEEKG